MVNDPVVWVLLGKGIGGNRQMISLAEGLGWPFTVKRLVFNPLNVLPNLLLDGTVLSLNRKNSDSLTPPWPDLVIGASRRSAPVAHWIKVQSAGRTRLVHLFHTQAPLHWFDLIITTPQYGLPQLPNILHNAAPLNPLPGPLGDDAIAHFGKEMLHLPRPLTAVLVGGNSSRYKMTAEVGTNLGRALNRRAAASGGSLAVTTSPRTPAPALAALMTVLEVPSYCYRWKPHDPDNPYPAILALADEIVVTVDSASLLTEACATGKPVHIFRWPPRPRWLPSGGENRLYKILVYWGLIKPPRDFSALHRTLQSRGLVIELEGSPPTARQPLDDLPQALAAIRRLMRGEPPVERSAPHASMNLLWGG